jgi:hypothetical protein
MYRLVLIASVCAILAAVAEAAPSTEPAEIYQNTLGNLFQPDSVPQYDQAHQILEDYFAATTSTQRKTDVDSLNSLGLDPAVIGRLARIRSSWSKLDPGVYYINDTIGSHNVRYFLGIPSDYTPEKSWPLMVKLPAANAFLTDPPPSADQVTKIYSGWILDELQAHPDALVLMPLFNLNELYGPGATGMNLVIQPILHAAGKVNIDPAQVYLMGHSLAAHAVWNIAIHYPTYFAGINPLAGSASQSWQRLRLGDLSNVNIVMWADASDDVIPVDDSRSLVRYFQTLDRTVDYTETKDLGHAPSQAILDEEYGKLRSTKRTLYPKQVYIESNSPDTIYNRVDWLQIYQPLNSGQTLKLLFTIGGQSIDVYSRVFRAIAEFTGPNTISINTNNVESVRFYLNDQMVDFSQPINIIVNGKSHFDQVVPTSVDEMLKDQTFLGRGWRYFTAIIDLDLTDTPANSEASAPTTEPVPTGKIEYTTPDGQTKIYGN